MLVKEYPYAKVFVFKEDKICKVEWIGKSTNEEYRSVFLEMLKIQKEYKLTRYLSDITKQSVVSPENRQWFETVALPQAIDGGLVAAGVVFDGNVFKKYYLNVILKATNKFGLPLKFFKETEEARDWLLSKS